jgi:hypothetical protein
MYGRTLDKLVDDDRRLAAALVEGDHDKAKQIGRGTDLVRKELRNFADTMNAITDGHAPFAGSHRKGGEIGQTQRYE